MPPGDTTLTDDPTSDAPEPVSAARHLPSHLRVWPVAAVGLTVDLWTKSWAFRAGNVPPEGRPLIEGILSFDLSLNPGALFGLGRGMAPLFVAASVLALLFVWYLFIQSTRDRRSLHVALGLILAGALGNLYDRSTQQADAIFGPPLSGFQRLLGDHVYATGVLVEPEDDRNWHLARFPDGQDPIRVIRKGPGFYLKSCPVVRDFIKIDATMLGQPIWRWIFNVADAMLTVGVGLLLLNFWWERRAAVRAESAPSEADAPAAG